MMLNILAKNGIDSKLDCQSYFKSGFTSKKVGKTPWRNDKTKCIISIIETEISPMKGFIWFG